MKLTCPACSTRYLVDPRALGVTGRKVRCVRCKHVWFAAPAEGAVPVGLSQPAPLPSLPAEEFPPPRFQLPAVPPPQRPRWLVAAWAGLAAVVVLTLGGVTLYRDELFRAAEPPGTGLDFRNVRASGETELVVEGEVVNTTTVFRAVPPFKAVVHADGKELAATPFRIAEKELPPGGAASFRMSITRPTTEAAELRLQVDRGS